MTIAGIIVLTTALAATALGGHHDRAIMPASCQSEKDTMRTCVQDSLKTDGFTIDISAIEQCFESSAICGTRQDTATQAPESDTSNLLVSPEKANFMKFMDCFRSKSRASSETCIAEEIKFATVAGEAAFNMGGVRSSDRERRRRTMSDKARPANQGEHHRRDKRRPPMMPGNRAGVEKFKDSLVRLVLARADQCGVKECVANLIPDELETDKEKAKTVLCKAIKQCRPSDAASTCATERVALAQAQCKCRKSADPDVVKAECQSTTGVTLPPVIAEHIGAGPPHLREQDCTQVQASPIDFYANEVMGCDA